MASEPLTTSSSAWDEPETPSRRGPIVVAAVMGAAALGAILTFSMGGGTVVVEGSSQGTLPEDVIVVLRGGGKELEISSADKWKLSVLPGTYQVDLKGGSDSFEIKEHEITIKRFGQQIVKLSRSATVAAAPDAPVKPLAAAAATDTWAGRWKITEAENLEGEAYGGIVQIRVSSTGVVDLDWLDENGNIVQTGVGLVADGRLFAAWGVIPAYGFCLYKLEPDGKMEARWTLNNAAGRLATESAMGGTPGKMEGAYNIQGSPIGSSARYTGTLSVAKQGETYSVEWTTAEGKFQGIGLRQGDYLPIAWSLKEPSGYGIVEYTLKQDEAEGRWTMIGQNRLSFEVLQRAGK